MNNQINIIKERKNDDYNIIVKKSRKKNKQGFSWKLTHNNEIIAYSENCFYSLSELRRSLRSIKKNMKIYSFLAYNCSKEKVYWKFISSNNRILMRSKEIQKTVRGFKSINI